MFSNDTRHRRYAYSSSVVFDLESLSDQQVSALRATFSQREWWKRIWVIQEAVSAKEIKIICGSKSLSWHKLEKILSLDDDSVLVKYSKAEVRSQLASTMHTAILFTAVRKLFQQPENSHEKGLSKRTLFSLLGLFETNECTIPRDLIYALQNIITDDSGFVTPDYGKSTIEVFAEATKIIVASGDLDVLAYAYRSRNPPERQNEGRHLGWVPDWSVQRHISAMIVSSMPHPLYSAGGGQPQSFTIEELLQDPFWILSIKGYVEDEVSELLKEVDCGDTDWKGWFWARYCNGIEPDMDSFWRTLMLDVRRPTGWPVRLDSKDVTYYRNLFLGWIQPSIYHNLSISAWDSERSWPETSFSDCLGDHLHGWIFCRTTHGRLGWVPSPSEVGDKILLASGSSLPLIVRQSSESPSQGILKFEFIGTCYIHGLMDRNSGGNIIFDHIHLT